MALVCPASAWQDGPSSSYSPTPHSGAGDRCCWDPRGWVPVRGQGLICGTGTETAAAFIWGSGDGTRNTEGPTEAGTSLNFPTGKRLFQTWARNTHGVWKIRYFIGLRSGTPLHPNTNLQTEKPWRGPGEPRVTGIVLRTSVLNQLPCFPSLSLLRECVQFKP